VIHRYARQFGLGNLTYIDLPYEESGYMLGRRQRSLRGKGRWHTGDTLNLSIGQGDLLVTPLQMVRVVSTIANNGIEVQPHVIKAIKDVAVDQYDFKRNLRIGKEALETAQKGMRSAVANSSGTANVLEFEDLYVAGKTGTAQTSGEQESHAWFIGYAKGKKKNIAFCVFLEHGGSSHNACLVARQLLQGMRKNETL